MRNLLILLLLIICLCSCNLVGEGRSTGLDDRSLTQSAELIPTPGSDSTCTITGYLFENVKEPSSIVGASLYLGEIISNNEGDPVMATMNRISSLRAVTDSNGRFIFVEVPANNYYSLIFDRVTDSFMLYDPKDSGDFIIQCNGGSVLNLGELVYDVLP
ncbi:MAG: hypothetical protein JW704_06845 [Anaerolineaceae bacterium]|nr:hypothetical protein [Anaerolineaceae bacterium]